MELLLLKLESTEDVHDDLLLLLLSRSTTSPSVVDFFSQVSFSLDPSSWLNPLFDLTERRGIVS